MSVLRLATLWQLAGARALAIERLSEMDVNSVEKIVLSQTYDIPEWMGSSLQELASRANAIAMEDAQKIGLTATYRVFELREMGCSCARVPTSSTASTADGTSEATMQGDQTCAIQAEVYNLQRQLDDAHDETQSLAQDLATRQSIEKAVVAQLQEMEAKLAAAEEDRDRNEQAFQDAQKAISLANEEAYKAREETCQKFAKMHEELKEARRLCTDAEVALERERGATHISMEDLRKKHRCALDQLHQQKHSLTKQLCQERDRLREEQHLLVAVGQQKAALETKYIEGQRRETKLKEEVEDERQRQASEVASPNARTTRALADVEKQRKENAAATKRRADADAAAAERYRAADAILECKRVADEVKAVELKRKATDEAQKHISEARQEAERIVAEAKREAKRRRTKLDEDEAVFERKRKKAARKDRRAAEQAAIPVVDTYGHPRLDSELERRASWGPGASSKLEWADWSPTPVKPKSQREKKNDQ